MMGEADAISAAGDTRADGNTATMAAAGGTHAGGNNATTTAGEREATGGLPNPNNYLPPIPQLRGGPAVAPVPKQGGLVPTAAQPNAAAAQTIIAHTPSLPHTSLDSRKPRPLSASHKVKSVSTDSSTLMPQQMQAPRPDNPPLITAGDTR